MLSGAAVRAMREELGLSQSGLGAALGVDKGTVYRWEKETIARTAMLEVALRGLLCAARHAAASPEGP